jgi:hypothetical protein
MIKNMLVVLMQIHSQLVIALIHTHEKPRTEFREKLTIKIITTQYLFMSFNYQWCNFRNFLIDMECVSCLIRFCVVATILSISFSPREETKCTENVNKIIQKFIYFHGWKPSRVTIIIIAFLWQEKIRLNF